MVPAPRGSGIVAARVLTLFSALFTVLFGMMFRFKFFLNNSFPVVFLVFFLFQLNMLFGNVVYSKDTARIKRNLWSLFPPYLSQALLLLSNATSTPKATGISWSKGKTVGVEIVSYLSWQKTRLLLLQDDFTVPCSQGVVDKLCKGSVPY